MNAALHLSERCDAAFMPKADENYLGAIRIAPSIRMVSPLR